VTRHRQHYAARQFEFIEADDPRPVVLSQACLEQVLENLISNAEKYSPAHAPITVAVSRPPGEVQVRVLDGGGGIGEESEAHRLFTPFYRSPEARERAEGLGIGLAVCKRLVEAHGGRMWARNRAEGGSEFGFAFPAVEDDE
jgi:two-component system sensor histidine kinase KdpD